MTEKEYRVKFARVGGLARAASLSKAERIQIARKAGGSPRKTKGNSHQRRIARRAAKKVNQQGK